MSKITLGCIYIFILIFCILFAVAGIIGSKILVCIFGIVGFIGFLVDLYRKYQKLDKDLIESNKISEEEQSKLQEMHRKRIVSDNIGEKQNTDSDELTHSEFMKEILGEKTDDFSYDKYRGDKYIDPNLMSKSYARGETNEVGNIIRYKDGNGVEGIVEGREYNQIDTDNDGRILVSEYYPLTEEEVLANILAVDANFSKTQFKSFVRGIFMLIQKAWSNNDYRSLRAFEADTLYYEHKVRIEDLINNKVYDRRENIGIKGVLLKDFKVEGDQEYLVVALTARMDRDFSGDVYKSRDSGYYGFKSSLSSNSGNVPYIMTFARRKGVKTKNGISLSTTNCCNCGAVISVDDNGVCKYCNTSLVSGEVDWVLVDIKNIQLVEF